MADNYLITGYWGEPHVTSENDRGINAGIFGTGKFVLPVGERFRAEYIGNNTIRMYDGKLIDNGAAAGIPAGRYVDLLISETGQGKKRNDLIVFQYSKDSSTLVESGAFVVIKGAETTETPTDPALTNNNLLSDEATLDHMALWRVSVSGTVISTPVQLFDVYVPTQYALHGIKTAGSNKDYTANVDGIKSLTAGESFIMIPHATSSTTTPTLDVNGLGAKGIRRGISGEASLTAVASTAGWLLQNKPVLVTYNGTYWVVCDRKPNANDIYGIVPVTKGGTGAGNATEALQRLGGMSKVKLWQNGDAGATFAAQNITVDTSEYSGIEIVHISADGSIYSTGFIPAKAGNAVALICMAYSSTSMLLCRRVATIGNGILIFSAATQALTTGAPTTNNRQCVPVYVFGIKNVNV